MQTSLALSVSPCLSAPLSLCLSVSLCLCLYLFPLFPPPSLSLFRSLIFLSPSLSSSFSFSLSLFLFPSPSLAFSPLYLSLSHLSLNHLSTYLFVQLPLIRPPPNLTSLFIYLLYLSTYPSTYLLSAASFSVCPQPHL